MRVDVDRFSPEWLLASLALHTGTRLEVIRRATLRIYEGTLYPEFHVAGCLPWVISVKLSKSARFGPGLQFCPYCLRTDPIPYFRLHWRVALHTLCEQHQCLLLDRCPNCGACLFIQGVDTSLCHVESDGICYCHSCDYDLRLAESAAIDDRGSGLLPQLQRLTHDLSVVSAPGLRDLLERLHAMVVTALSGKVKPRLCNCLACHFGYADLEIERAKKPELELQSVLTRHTVLLWSLWLLQHDLEAHGRLIKPIAPLHHQFIKDILMHYGLEAAGQRRSDLSAELSIMRTSSPQIRDGRVVQLH